MRSRRTLLRLAGLGLATLLGWQAIERLAPAVRLPTGSKPVGDAFPAEIWLFDSVPSLDPATWRLHLPGREVSLDELLTLPRRDIRTVLDCTSGWWTEQTWSGVPVLDVVPAEAKRVAFVSVTGHRIVHSVDELGDAILATHLGGEPLSPDHGYPLRLVVPGWRGYHWVKWLALIEEV